MSQLQPRVIWRTNIFLALVLALGTLTGCERRPPEQLPASRAERTATQTEPVMLNPAEASPPTANDAALFQSLLADGAEGEPKTEADKAWRDLQQALESPPPPREWLTNRPSEKDQADFEKRNAELAVKAAEKAKDFYARYPDHPRAEAARKQEHELLSDAALSGHTNALVRLQILEAALLKDPNLAEDDRLLLRVQQLTRAFSLSTRVNPTNALGDFEKGLRSLQTEFPQQPGLYSLFVAAANQWLDYDPQKSRALAREVAGSRAEEEVRELAQSLLKKLDRLGKPFPLKFTAIDGRQVDLTQMAGKVVLVDFWATWCAPCMDELPKLKATYEKLHPRGFEIVGISLDESKAPLQQVIDREKIPWPQHFDETNEENKFAEEFDVSAIPTMWLVDSQGLLRDLNARDNLAEKVERLLGRK